MNFFDPLQMLTTVYKNSSSRSSLIEHLLCAKDIP